MPKRFFLPLGTMIFLYLVCFSSTSSAFSDYVDCTNSCETTKEQIWACNEAYCKLFDTSSYDAMSSQQQCAFDCIWDYRSCKSLIGQEGSTYNTEAGPAFKDAFSKCGDLYSTCMKSNSINAADPSELDSYCQDQSNACYTSLRENYCKPYQTACVAKCSQPDKPSKPTSTPKCSGSTDYEQYCTSYCKIKSGPECTFTAYAVEKDPIISDCYCTCSGGDSVSYHNLDCSKSLPSPAPKDKCATVSCPNKCENGMSSSDGVCDSNTGECVYSQTQQCTSGCSADGSQCKKKLVGEVFFTDAQGKKVPVKFVKLEITALQSTSTPGMRKIVAREQLATDENGKFTFDNDNALAAGNQISIDIQFDESKGRLYLVDPSLGSSTFPITYSYVSDLSASDPTLSNYEMDLTKYPSQRLVDDAKVYDTVQKAVDYKEKVLKVTGTIKERVIVPTTMGNSHLNELYSDSNPDITGMRLLDMSSHLTTSYIEDTLFHEYCHHIQDEIFQTKTTPPGSDHGGYYGNTQSSGYGLVEGWAEYCAWDMKHYYQLKDEFDLYRIRGEAFDLELNYKMDEKFFRDSGKFHSPSMVEEMAIAAIFVDLRDSVTQRGHDDDFVALPASTLFDAYSKTRDFGDGRGVRHVENIRDFYLAINASTADIPSLHEPYKQGTTRTTLDQVFLMHGAYQDLNKNGIWNEGEPFGYSGKGSTLTAYRTDLDAENGTEVLLDLKDQSGNSLAGKESVFVHVDVKFSGDNSWLSYSYDVPLSDGRVNVPAPPREYDAIITMYAFQAGTTNKASKSFIITTKQFYDTVDAEKPIGTYSATVQISPVSSQSCQTDFQCISWGAGNTCANSKCTQTSSTSISCSSDSDCSPTARCNSGECKVTSDSFAAGMALPISSTTSGGSLPCCGTSFLLGAVVLGVGLVKRNTA